MPISWKTKNKGKLTTSATPQSHQDHKYYKHMQGHWLKRTIASYAYPDKNMPLELTEIWGDQ
jgi:hypothetical protein